MSQRSGLVYVVDDDLSVREGLASLVSSAGLTARTAASGQEFLAMTRPEGPSCMVLDVNLPDLNGIELQQQLLRCGIQMPIIFLTGHGDIPMTVRALKAGAANFLTKPVDDEELLNAIRECLVWPLPADGLEDLENEFVGVVSSGEEDNKQDGFERLIGKSAALRFVLQMVETVAPNDTTVLLLGETGTGKELIARAIHDHSRRKLRNFVKLNCAAIPTGLLESELFGHEKGAFTNAFAQKLGRLEQADQGTLFLDEVGDIPLEVQPKLLRALQEREFERLGSTHTRKVNIRLVAATNRDLDKMVANREFRSDLYYRLNVFPIRIPPLRERREDIPLLASHFVRKFARQTGKRIDTIPDSVMEGLVAWEWPGNIRELENFIERAVILTRSRSLEAPLAELRKTNTTEPGSRIWSDFERTLTGHDRLPTKANAAAEEYARRQCQAIINALIACNGCVGGEDGAAAQLGINRTTLLARMKKYGISPKQYAV